MNNRFKLSLLSGALIFSLTGCGDDKETEMPDVAPVASDVVVQNVKQWLPYKASLDAIDYNSDPLTVAFRENDQLVSQVDGIYTFADGILELDGLSFTYINVTGQDTEIEYSVTAKGKIATAKIIITGVQSDPLVNHQWHLRNTGQKAFALSDEMKQGLIDRDVENGKSEEEATAYWHELFAKQEASMLIPGEDINVMGAYKHGVTGQGVTAVVVGTGLEIRHEDLIDNVLPNRSLNLERYASDKTDPTNESDHGTSVAGLIAAKGWNGIGGRGVAPNTGLIGIKYLSNASLPANQKDLLIHGFPGSGISETEEISVFNRSYGSYFTGYAGLSELDEQIESYPNKKLRGGKGATNIKPIGNSFINGEEDGSWEGDFCADNGANELGLTCYNGNSERSQSHPYYFSVAAVNSNGKHISYSTAGANVLVSAPAGEDGRYAPAMVTTDSMTCLSGYSSFESPYIAYIANVYGEAFAQSQFPFNYPGHPENVSCNYTSTFNGTSSAAPNAAGVVSLILSANNDLTWRDVRHILASTSTKIDPTDPAISFMIGESEFIAHDGWVENAAGFSHNNLYGFGRVDAGAAVEMAKNYTADLGQEIITDWMGKGTAMDEPSLGLAIPDNNAEGLSYILTIEQDIAVEAIQFKFDVSNESFSFGFDTQSGKAQLTAGSDLAIEVTSPSGTRSVLLSSKQALILPAISDTWHRGYILKDAAMLSNAFYGESVKGDWTIKLLDVAADSYQASDGGNNYGGFEVFLNNSEDSVLESVAVRIFGHAVN